MVAFAEFLVLFLLSCQACDNKYSEPELASAPPTPIIPEEAAATKAVPEGTPSANDTGQRSKLLEEIIQQAALLAPTGQPLNAAETNESEFDEDNFIIGDLADEYAEKPVQGGT